MKNVVVLGCSHSSWRTHDKVWPIQLAKKYPNLNIMNYSQPGHGHYHQDLILKWLMYESDIQIDWIIVAFTGPNRVQMPIPMAHKLENIFKSVLPDDADVPSNYNEYSLRTMRFSSPGIDPLKALEDKTFEGKNIDGMKVSDEYMHEALIENNKHLGNVTWSEAVLFSDLYKKQLIDMSKYFPVSCFTIWNLPNCDNIGMKQTFYKITRQRIGDEGWAKLLDDTMHLNEEGNRLLLEHLESLPLFNQHLH